jgi:signal transduction histidine kinase
MFYNDGYIPILGVTKHPGWLGRSGKECWKEIWSTVGPMLEGVFETGVATWSEDLLLVMDRNIPREENYFTFSYSPIRDDAGKVPGIFCACYESTEQVVRGRRLQTLRDLGRTVIDVKSAEEACEAAARTLEVNPHDVPFALLYLLEDGFQNGAQNARLIATTGFKETSETIPEQVALEESSVWPFLEVFKTGSGGIVTGLTTRFGALPGGPWPDSPEAAYVLPIAAPGKIKPTGFLVAGLSPRRVVDADYRSFFDLIAGHVGTAIANARAYQEERKRAEALAEIDRAKTAFFSNVSHEFRTPLTLMLGPLEEAVLETRLLPDVRERLDGAHRNSIRLLKLVNTLLDFSRIEAGRIEAVYERVDLCALTRELASVFRSAVEKAGLSLVIDCEPVSTPVYVDREMWEKIVFNLVSNAFKFTFEGEIAVALKEKGDRVELSVSDTGTGIPEAELQHLFERFHRVKGARGRSYEGSGIGLALVQELVKLHHGSVGVVSEVERGSTFTVSIPTGMNHLPADRLGAGKTLVSTNLRGEAYVEEAAKWLPLTGDSIASVSEPEISEADAVRPRILLADDNADMRDYVRRLLANKFDVEAVGDGEAALEAARAGQFDLVLSDVMMPKLDGFGLLHALRSDDKTRTIPVILLSARAGEESRVEGMGAGADDYLVKPFSARELLARVESHVNLQRERKRSEEKLEHLMVLEQQARASAEVANRVKDEFLAMLSHELRTPLNAIVGWIQLLKAGKLGEKDRARGIEVIDRNAAAQRAIIDELLDVSRIITGKLRLDASPVDPVTVLDAAIDAIRPAALAKEIEISVSIERNRGLVIGEAVRLQQVIWNVLSNAVKFTPKNGRIQVEFKVAGKQFEIVIGDTGEGIESEFLPYIFDRFRQADTSARRKHGGLGVGLSIVRSLVELHGGDVQVFSDGPGKGAMFTIRLPIMGLSDVTQSDGTNELIDSRWKQDHGFDDDVSPALLSGLKVLAVEDQQDTRDLITLALARFGAEVRASDSAASALETVASWQPNVIVSDIGLPEMDGYDFIRELRKVEGNGKRIPAIALTGYAGAVDESKALNAGYELHFSKPINLTALAHAIARLSGRA